MENAYLSMLADALRAAGSEDIVVSPGSRNAPVAALLHRSGMFRMHYVVDERSAAFVALGMAVQSFRPVALLCTSGSAVLDYAPALAEAYYSRIPLLAVTADRPARWVDQRDSQTIRQCEALRAVVRDCVDIHAGLSADHINVLLNKAIWAMNGRVPGPVQINVEVDVSVPAGEYGASPFRHIERIYPPAEPDVSFLRPYRRVLALFGGMRPDRRLQDAVRRLPCDYCAEVQANLPAGIPSRKLWKNVLDYDLILSAGGALVSAPLKDAVRRSGIPVVNIGYDDMPVDTFGNCVASVEADPTDFFSALATGPRREYGCSPSAPRSADASAVAAIIAGAPVGSVLHLSAGMSVRYAQDCDCSRFSFVWANRGVSGIDGCSSTALGAALATDSTVLLITGDMCAAYDVAAMACREAPANLRIAVISNGRGAIFDKVATTSVLPEKDSYCTPLQKFPLEKLAKAYGWNYFSVPYGSTEVPEAFFADSDAPAVLEFFTEPNIE